MKRCIFCLSTSVPFTTREHVLPESLGGGDWAILPEGFFCDSCQNKFGSEIEQQALNDYPFSFIRTFCGIPTKKSKAPWFKSWEGTLTSTFIPSIIHYDPASVFMKMITDREKTQIRLLAHPFKSHIVCRFLLKMGLEIVAVNNSRDVFSQKFDEARRFALTGDKHRKWWYLQMEKIDEAAHFIKQGITQTEWNDNVILDVFKLDDEQEIFHLKLLYIDIFVPLTTMIAPQFDGLEEPEYRLFQI